MCALRSRRALSARKKEKKFNLYNNYHTHTLTHTHTHTLTHNQDDNPKISFRTFLLGVRTERTQYNFYHEIKDLYFYSDFCNF